MHLTDLDLFLIGALLYAPTVGLVAAIGCAGYAVWRYVRKRQERRP